MTNKKQIVIIESAPTDTMTKMAKALKKLGYQTIFITLVGNIELDFLKESYDKLISFNAKFFKINLLNLPKIFLHGFKNSLKIINALFQIRKLKPHVVIGRATPNWLCALFRMYFKHNTFIYFPYDIRSFSYRSIDEAKSCGTLKFEIEAEKYCFENSDGIIHKGGEDELNYLNTTLLGDLSPLPKSIYFFPYCLQEFMVPIKPSEKISKKDKEIHTVYVGHVPDDPDWIAGMKDIIDQKIYLHLYSRTNNLTKEEERNRVLGFLKPFLNNKFLVLHESVSQKELAKEISKYDYGLYSYCNAVKRSYDNATGNKIASYLEAGLPIVSPAFYSAASKIIEDNKIGIIFPHEKFKKLRNILKRNKSERFYKNIIKARNFLSMENQILRLENFFKEVSKFKNL